MFYITATATRQVDCVSALIVRVTLTPIKQVCNGNGYLIGTKQKYAMLVNKIKLRYLVYKLKNLEKVMYFYD